ncbi:MAG: hypothetical protein FD177_475 [Desulfovibrionaceae bacterium]|nr:MAG: hypothetical protein FD177_475 [Desulfovibrionaceae bacterium]
MFFKFVCVIHVLNGIDILLVFLADRAAIGDVVFNSLHKLITFQAGSVFALAALVASTNAKDDEGNANA